MRTIRRHPRHGAAQLGRGDDAGFTVAEVIVAFLLFMILAGSAGVALTSAVRLSRANEARVVAANLAERQMEAVRGMAAADIVDGDAPTVTVDLDGRQYFVDQRTTLDTTGGSGAACGGASGPATFKRVRVQVTWNDMDGVAPVTSESLKALPVTGISNGTGVLSVPVQDAAGNGLPGVTVVLNNSRSATTAADGCAVFAGLAPSTTYVATVTVTGYISPTGAATASQGPLTVTAGGVTKSAAIVLDQQVSMSVTVGTPGSQYVLPAGIGVTVANTGMVGSPKAFPLCSATVTTSCATGTSTASTVSGLFPFSNGYEVWPGTCSNNRPTTPAVVMTTPGQTASGAASSAGGIRIVAKRNATTYRSGRYLWAVNATCPTEYYLFPGTTPDSDAGALTMALPAGSWQIKYGTSNNYVAASNVTSGSPVTVNAGTATGATTPVEVRVP
jgi:type II secretory pathway pseudopilin PulG